jgi:hypothetical protein
VKEYSYNFAQMTTPNWLPTGLVTWGQGVSGPYQRQHEERDINPSSASFGTARSVVDGTFPMCNPGIIPFGQTITLKGANNLYVSSENGGQPMQCNRAGAGGWEQFTVVNAGNGKVALMSQGKYVSSEGGNQAITCNRTGIGPWEQFDWLNNADGTISLRGSNNRFISNEAGIQAMTCNRTAAQSYESFLVNN